ncbi:MAG: sugar phosphate isomerase/epimerase [Caldilineaceae bacterium]|nr:sugar phosphate isomerase/epimerase [Caldilineaceae bacterium]
MKLGIDLFSLRFNDWDPFQHLEYAHRIGVDVVHFSELNPVRPLDSGYLAELKQTADRLGLQIEVGMRSICPTSTSFEARAGSAAEQLARMIEIAAQVGSPAVRCFLGSNADRRTALPLSGHIAATVETCRAVRDLALERGVKIAVENHAGDMQGRELAALIEQAGPDYVGACIDAGNPLWVAESPFTTLEHLAPYVVMSHVRDTAVSPHPSGAMAQWVAMGDGSVDIAAWSRRYQELCPNTNFTLEIITTLPPKVLNYLDPDFWSVYPDTPAHEFARFLALVHTGRPYTEPALTADWGDLTPELRAALAVEQQRRLEKSVRYCREVLGI